MRALQSCRRSIRRSDAFVNGSIRLQHVTADQDGISSGPLQGIKVNAGPPLSGLCMHLAIVRLFMLAHMQCMAAFASSGCDTQVLDVGQVVAGNFCGALLAYFGADVIKVRYFNACRLPTIH